MLIKSSWQDCPKTDLIVLPFWHDEQEKKAVLAFSDGAEPFVDLYPLLSGEFCAQEGEVVDLYLEKEGQPAKRILLWGLGVQSKTTPFDIQGLTASLVSLIRQRNRKRIAFFFPDFQTEKPIFHKAMVEGFFLANHNFGCYSDSKAFKEKEKRKDPITHVFSFGLSLSDQVLQEIIVVQGAVASARNMVSGNSCEINVHYLIERAKELEGRFAKVRLRLWDEAALKAAGFNLIVAVNQGASTPPALILLEYQGAATPEAPWQALVGKGVTFDTGGLNLKPTGHIETMRTDMAGAASCLQTLEAVAALDLKVNLLVLMPVVENATGAKSVKPGDVILSYKKLFYVEIGNTDAEGRLILADALAFLCEEYEGRLASIVDIATLTGAISVALGDSAAGLFCRDRALATNLLSAGERTSERLWLMPSFKEYRAALRSFVADLSNCTGSRQAGACTGAAFLQAFVDEKIPFAHIDLGGVAFLDKPSALHPTQATGFGVRLFVDFLKAQVSD